MPSRNGLFESGPKQLLEHMEMQCTSFFSFKCYFILPISSIHVFVCLGLLANFGVAGVPNFASIMLLDLDTSY
jgi:Na+/H+-dicarboxylate symporter